MAERVPRPTDAINYLKARLKVSVGTGHWKELSSSEHAHAFTAAHTAGFDVLESLGNALVKSMKEGAPFETFKKEMLSNPEVVKWAGGVEKGDAKAQDKYLKRRLDVIYQTNERTAMAAGRHRRQRQAARSRPYWRYSQVQRESKRKTHEPFHNKVLRHDDPFWDTYYPPNGWYCGCSVVSESESGLKREGLSVSSGEDEDIKQAISKAEVPKEWRYNVGQTHYAPDFRDGYKVLKSLKMDDGKTAFRHAVESYRSSMAESALSPQEFVEKLNQVEKPEYDETGVLYLAGVLKGKALGAVIKQGADGRLLASDVRMRHGTLAKNLKQKVPGEQYGDLYQVMNNPVNIYVNGEEIHLVGPPDKDGYVLSAVMKHRQGTAMELSTFSRVGNRKYGGKEYEKIK